MRESVSLALQGVKGAFKKNEGVAEKVNDFFITEGGWKISALALPSFKRCDNVIERGVKRQGLGRDG